MGKYYTVKQVKSKYGTYNRIIRTELGKQKLRETREIEKAYYEYTQDFKRTQKAIGAQFEGVLIGKKEFRQRVKASREDNPEVRYKTATEVYKKTLRVMNITTTQDQIFFEYITEWYSNNKTIVDNIIHHELVRRFTKIWEQANPLVKRKPTEAELKLPKVNITPRNMRYDKVLKAAVLRTGKYELFYFGKSNIRVKGSLYIVCLQLYTFDENGSKKILLA